MQVWLVPNLVPAAQTQVKGCERRNKGARVLCAPDLEIGTKILPQCFIENVVLIFLLVSLKVTTTKAVNHFFTKLTHTSTYLHCIWGMGKGFQVFLCSYWKLVEINWNFPKTVNNYKKRQKLFNWIGQFLKVSIPPPWSRMLTGTSSIT